jgi:hypothetical protein
MKHQIFAHGADLACERIQDSFEDARKNMKMARQFSEEGSF